MAIAWPERLLIPSRVKLSLQSSSRGGGQTIDGNEQLVTSPASQRWALTYAGIAIRTTAQIRAWRAIEAQADGRANALALPIYDAARAPVLSMLEAGLSFAAGRFLPVASAVTLSVAALANVTSLTIAWAGPAPEVGQHFSVAGQLYRIASLAAAGPLSAVVTIRPWLRAPVAAGTALEFDAPQCLMRLVKDDGMALDLDLWRFDTPSIDFIEFF